MAPSGRSAPSPLPTWKRIAKNCTRDIESRIASERWIRDNHHRCAGYESLDQTGPRRPLRAHLSRSTCGVVNRLEEPITEVDPMHVSPGADIEKIGGSDDLALSVRWRTDQQHGSDERGAH